MDDYEQLAQYLVDRGVLKTPSIIEAFKAIDRRDFVIPEMEDLSYADSALPTLSGQTISQPYTVAFMLELLQPEAGHNILDIGYGSGWQTTLLAHIVGDRGHVVAMEIVPELCEMGQKNVTKYSFIEKGTVEMHCQSGISGFEINAPYDGVIAAADASMKVPEAWLKQTKVGGRIVVPMGNNLTVLTRESRDRWAQEDHPGFAFVPLVD